MADHDVQPITVSDLIEALNMHDPDRQVMVRMSPGYALHLDVIEASVDRPLLLIHLSHAGTRLS